MKNKKGFTLVELLGVIVVLAIIVAIAVPTFGRISSNIDKKQYQNKLELIKAAALKYADDTNYVAFYINDLVENGYLDADDAKGVVINNIDGTSMNCFPIEIKTGNNEMKYANITEENQEKNGECDLDYLASANEYFAILQNGIDISSNIASWTNTDVTLSLGPKEGVQILKSVWFVGLTGDGEEAPTKYIEASSAMVNQIYKVVATVAKNGKERVVEQYFKVKIDNVPPKFKSSDKRNIFNDGKTWVKKASYTPKASDTDSGYYGSRLITSGECPNDKSSYDKGKATYELNNGNYKICIIDNVGNVNSDDFTVSNIDNVDMQCNMSVSSGTAGNNVNGVQWYKSDVTLKVTPQAVGGSGVDLAVNDSANSWPLPSQIKSFTYAQYRDNPTSVCAANAYKTNAAAKTYYGHIRNKTGDDKTCSVQIAIEKAITPPTLSSATSTYDSITATYSEGSAISGIASTNCYQTDETGNIIINEVKPNGNKCIFPVRATMTNTTYYFKRCITSKAGNTACSKVLNKPNVGYCTKEHYNTLVINKSETVACGTCGRAQNTYTYNYKYTSKYNNLDCGTSAPQTGHDSCSYPNCCSSKKWVPKNDWSDWDPECDDCTGTCTQTSKQTVNCISSIDNTTPCSGCDAKTKNDTKTQTISCSTPVSCGTKFTKKAFTVYASAAIMTEYADVTSCGNINSKIKSATFSIGTMDATKLPWLDGNGGQGVCQLFIKGKNIVTFRDMFYKKDGAYKGCDVTINAGSKAAKSVAKYCRYYNATNGKIGDISAFEPPITLRISCYAPAHQVSGSFSLKKVEIKYKK